VTREDQDKINAFSRLHRREKALQEELQTKQVRLILYPLISSSPSPVALAGLSVECAYLVLASWATVYNLLLS
jgi:hypothetical protein